MRNERQPLTDLLADSHSWDAALTDATVRPSDITFNAEGVCVAGRQFAVSDATWKKVLSKVGAPAWYFNRRTPELRAVALQEHLKEGAFGRTPRVVLGDNTLATIGSGELIDLTFGEVLGAALDACQERNESLFVSGIARSEERLELELISPTTTVDVRPGDVVYGGIEIIHERYGVTATQIQVFVYRLVCSNGLTRRECVSSDTIVRTRRLPVTLASARELQLDQIRRLVRQTLGSLEPQLRELKRTSERPADVEELLRRWLQRARISEKNMMPRLLEAWQMEGSEPTHYGAVNALTRVGTHDESLTDRQGRALATLGGLLAFSHVHICSRCFSVLGSEAEGFEVAA